MMTLYRRHKADCAKVADRYWRRCNCPMWVEGTLDRHYIRQSLKTVSWERAKQVVDSWEALGEVPAKKESVLLTEAFKQYMGDCEQRGLRPSTIRNTRMVINAFVRQSMQGGYRTIGEIDLAAVQEFFAKQWKGSTRVIYAELLRGWFEFGIRNGWLGKNPTENLSKPIVRHIPTECLDQREYAALLAACNETLRPIVLLMRWSGLRISDVLSLTKNKIINGDLVLYQSKTGMPVRVPLPVEVLRMVEGLPDPLFPGNYRDKYVRVHRGLARAAKKAGIAKKVTPHMFRDTFAVELLIAGVPLDQVSTLLGHSSIAITQKHYAPWVKARQDQLNVSVRSSWMI